MQSDDAALSLSSDRPMSADLAPSEGVVVTNEGRGHSCF